MNRLWYYAADHGVPEEALDTLYELVQDPDPEVAEEAQVALEDLQRLLEESEAVNEAPTGYDNSGDLEGFNLVSEGLETGNPEASEQWTALVWDAYFEPDDDRRADTVDAVALERHDEAVAALIDVAALDPVAEIRYRTLEALWYAAADGLDTDGLMEDTLEDALGDPDPDIAALAKRALEDLQTPE